MASETESKQISQKVDRATSNPAKSDHARPTIDCLAVRIGDSISQILRRGVVDAARDHNVNLISFAGQRNLRPGEFRGRGRAGDLGLFGGRVLEYDETVAFHRRYHPLPIVSITLPMGSRPTRWVGTITGRDDRGR
jgi:hypothetical protein